MKRRLTILTLTTLAVVALIGAVSVAPSPAHAGGATQISGVGFLDESDACDSASVGADFAVIMTGDLDGCLYTFVDTQKSSPSGTYLETGRELFVASEGPAASERPTDSRRSTKILPIRPRRSSGVANIPS
jgi:hypothetical protein